ncbi:MAG: hypothetical protein ACKO7R_19325, partial [Pseudanabaena sp.]
PTAGFQKTYFNNENCCFGVRFHNPQKSTNDLGLLYLIGNIHLLQPVEALSSFESATKWRFQKLL